MSRKRKECPKKKAGCHPELWLWMNSECTLLQILSLAFWLSRLIYCLFCGWFCLFVLVYLFFFFVEGSKFGNPDKKRAIEGHYWNRVPHHTWCIDSSVNQHGFFRCTMKLCFPRVPLQDSRLSCKAVLSQAVSLSEAREWLSMCTQWITQFTGKKTKQNYFGLTICPLFPELE